MDYWPPGIDREESIDSFMKAFATLGYRACDNGRYEVGFQKLAIYADADLTPTHMARQHMFGSGWLSKLGDYEDIWHRELRSVEGDTNPRAREYGTAIQFLKRSWWAAFLHALRRCIERMAWS